MHDLLGDREKALNCYWRIQNEGSGLISEKVELLLDQPFDRPHSGRGD
jgi:hypothetical protein